MMPRWSEFEPYFWSLVEKTASCWIWKGGVDGKGYGRIHKDQRRQGAHRVSYELTIGAIKNGLFACHSCDNKLCVNPSHIFLGTQKDNMQDWTKKGFNKALGNGTFAKKGDEHWMRTEKGRKYLASRGEKTSKDFMSGKRAVIRGDKGRVLGTIVK